MFDKSTKLSLLSVTHTSSKVHGKTNIASSFRLPLLPNHNRILLSGATGLWL